MSLISEKIRAIESELNLKEFTYKNENVWPVIRMALYLSSTKSTSARQSSLLRLLIFWIGGLFYFLYYRILTVFFRKDIDAVVVTTSHYKVTEDGKVYDRIIDPVLDYLKKRKIRFGVWEFTGKFKYDRSISYKPFIRRIQQEIYFLSTVRRVLRMNDETTPLKGDVGKLNSLLQKHGLEFKVDKNFRKKLDLLFFQADYFQQALQRHKVRNVFVVCYYDVKCFSIILAANRLGIPSIDLQHGVQGKNHMAYAQWPEEVINNTRLLPTHFYVWDDNSRKVIEAWKKERDQIILGCNKWVLDRAVKRSNNILLVTLQPIDNFLPDFLIRLIKDYKGNKKWFVRLHPRQYDELERVESILEKEGLTDKIELRKATFQSLTSILEHTALHITFYSSVVIEAGYYHIPTYFLDKKYLVHYCDYLDPDLIYHYPEHSLDDVIDFAENDTRKRNTGNRDRINELDKFLQDG